MFFDQAGAAVRCEWGEAGVRHLAPRADAVVIVDVLSFGTCVDVALSRGAAVLPFPWLDERAAAFAQARGALLSSPDRQARGSFTLSPSSLLALPGGARLVLPSPNGAALCALAESVRPGRVFAACLRNAAAVGEALAGCASVLVVPAGERWPDGSLRPALEDWLGAGAVIAALRGARSPEAEAAAQAYLGAGGQLHGLLRSCSSGRELLQRGFGADVTLAAQVQVSGTVPQLLDGAFRPAAVTR